MIVTLPAGLGLVADQAAHDAPDGAWSLISNMRFVDGYAERCKGHLAVLTTPSAAPYHVVRYQVGSTVFWVHATLTGAFADDATTKTDISGTAFTGDADDTFTSCVLGGVLCLNNGKDVPVFGAATRARTMQRLRAGIVIGVAKVSDPSSTTCWR